MLPTPSMIEDALKLTRTIHRLIIVTSGIVLVFAFSLSLPDEKVRQRQIIESLLTADFLAYNSFVDERVEKAGDAIFPMIVTEARETIKTANSQVLNDFEIAESFGTPAHIGRILVADTILSDISATTLGTLDALNGLSLDRDVQIVALRADATKEIAAFLDSNSGFRIVDDLEIEFNGPGFYAETFFPPDPTATFSISFTLPLSVSTEPVPQYQALVTADVIELPDTSFLSWVESNADLEGVADVAEGEIRFVPSLGEQKSGIRETKLGSLANELDAEIAALGPDKQTATFLGTTVPGRLVLIAAPILLIVLLHYLLNHTRHLRSVVNEDPNSFLQFAWLPLMKQDGLPYNWHVELIATIVVAPTGALLLLLYKLSDFGDLSTSAVIIYLAAGILIAALGLSVVRQIRIIRERLEYANASHS